MAYEIATRGLIKSNSLIVGTAIPAAVPHIVGFYSVEVCVLSVSTALESHLYRCTDMTFPPSPGGASSDIAGAE